MTKVGTPLRIDVMEGELSQQQPSQDIEPCEPQLPKLISGAHVAIAQSGKVCYENSKSFKGYECSIATISWYQAQLI